MKWLRKFNEESPWLQDFICPNCGHILTNNEEDNKCSHCGIELNSWEDEHKVTVTVSVYREYEVDVSHLAPEYVRVEKFAKDEALRMFEQDYIDGILNPEDFNAIVLGGTF